MNLELDREKKEEPFYSDPILEKKRLLTKKLEEEGRLWSYKKNDNAILPDDELIELSLNYLELEEMWMLWDIFPESKIRQVWEKEMLSNDAFYGITNQIVAYTLFGIKDFDKYKEEVCGRKG